jgi:hypothetical protein
VSGGANGPAVGSCPSYRWQFGDVSTCSIQWLCANSPTCNECADFINCGWCSQASKGRGSIPAGSCIVGDDKGPSLGNACPANTGYVYAKCAATPFPYGPDAIDYGGQMPSEGVGAIVLMIIYFTIAGALLFLYLHDPIGLCKRCPIRWKPEQGSGGAIGYTSRIKLGIPIVLSAAALAALIIALAVDRWTFHRVTRDGVKMDLTHGLLTYRVKSYDQTRMESFSMSYVEYCDQPNLKGDDCNVMRAGALLTIAFGVGALTFTVVVLLLSLMFYWKPALQRRFIYRAWFFAAVGCLCNFCAGNSYGCVTHLVATGMDGGDIGISWNAQLGSFIVLWVLRIYYFYATQSTAVPEGIAGSSSASQDTATATEMQEADMKKKNKKEKKGKEEKTAGSAAAVYVDVDPSEDPSMHAARVMVHPSLPTSPSNDGTSSSTPPFSPSQKAALQLAALSAASGGNRPSAATAASSDDPFGEVNSDTIHLRFSSYQPPVARAVPSTTGQSSDNPFTQTASAQLSKQITPTNVKQAASAYAKAELQPHEDPDSPFFEG